MPVHVKGGGGAGFPLGWKDNFQASVVVESIVKGDPVVTARYGSFDTQIDPIPDPDSLTANANKDIAFTPDGMYMAISNQTGVAIHKYDGTKFSFLKTLSLPVRTYTYNSVNRLYFTKNGNYLVARINCSSPAVSDVAVWERSGETYTLRTGGIPVVAMVASADVFLSNDGVYLMTPSSSSAATIYKWNGTSYGLLGSLIGSNLKQICVSPDEMYWFGGGNIYKKSSDTFTSVQEFSNAYSSAFSADGIYFAIGMTTTGLQIYKRSGDVFTAIANPSVLPPGNITHLEFSQDGMYLVVCSEATPYVTIYKRNGDVFSKLANPTKIPTAAGYGIAFSGNGTYLGVSYQASPWVTIYRTTSMDIVQKITSLKAIPFSWLPLPAAQIGVAKDDGAVGAVIRINRFPKINDML